MAKRLAFGYGRVSSRDQVSGDGLVRQRVAIEKYAAENGIQVVQFWTEEGVSGKTDLENRPAFQQMRSAIVNGDVRIVLIEKLDRLARFLIYQESFLRDLQNLGVELIPVMEPDLCSDDPTRTMMRQIMGAFAQYERTMIVNRTRAARERIRATGQRCEGRKPYGANDNELKVVGMILGKYCDGLSVGEIADFLNSLPITTRSGGNWFPAQVRRVIDRYRTPLVSPDTSAPCVLS